MLGPAAHSAASTPSTSTTTSYIHKRITSWTSTDHSSSSSSSSSSPPPLPQTLPQMHLHHSSSRDRTHIWSCLDISYLSAALFFILATTLIYIITNAMLFSSSNSFSSHPIIDYQAEDIPLHAATTAVHPLSMSATTASTIKTSTSTSTSPSTEVDTHSIQTIEVQSTSHRPPTSIIASHDGLREAVDPVHDEIATNTQPHARDVQRVVDDIDTFVEQWKKQYNKGNKQSIQRKFIVISDDTLNSLRKVDQWTRSFVHSYSLYLTLPSGETSHALWMLDQLENKARNASIYLQSEKKYPLFQTDVYYVIILIGSNNIHQKKHVPNHVYEGIQKIARRVYDLFHRPQLHVSFLLPCGDSLWASTMSLHVNRRLAALSFDTFDTENGQSQLKTTNNKITVNMWDFSSLFSQQMSSDTQVAQTSDTIVKSTLDRMNEILTSIVKPQDDQIPQIITKLYTDDKWHLSELGKNVLAEAILQKINQN